MVHAQAPSVPWASAGPGLPLPLSGVTAADDPADSKDPNPAVRERTAEDDEAIAAKEAKKAARGAARNEERDASPESDAPVPNAPIVRAIEFQGASAEDSKKASSAIRTRVGEPLNPTKQREDIRKLYDLGLFRPNVVIQADKVEGGVKLRYVVEPNPKVSDITVAGNSQIPTEKILNQLPVKKDGVYTIQAQDKLRSSVARYYEEKGFSDAVVKVDERVGPDNTVGLSVSVDEGTKIKIKDMVFRGNDSIGNLKLLIRVQNKGSWGPFQHYFNESKFQQDIEAVKAVYIQRGYLDVEVQRGDFVYAQDQSWVNPVIDIREGPRYKIGRLEAKGYTLFTREEVLSPFRGLQGDYYDVKRFETAAKKVKNMYGDEGFITCQVEPDFHKDAAKGVVDVDIDVTEGSRIYVGDVKVLSQTYPDDTEMGWLRRYYSRFSPPVKDEVVQREVRLRPGQVYRRFDEVRTTERLKSLNVFEEVTVHDQLSADPNVRDVVVDCTQGNTGNLIFGVGFGDVEGAFVYANYIERNLFGMARDLRLSVMFGSDASAFEASYLDRWFMGRDLAAQFTAFHRQWSRTGDIDQTNTGMTAEFTRTLSECLKDSFRLRLENVSFDLGDVDPEPDAEINDYVAATFRYKLTRDTRDDKFFPTDGTILAGSVETGVADGFLLKLEGQYARYFRVGDQWVYAMNNQVGLIPMNSDDIGYADRFFLGGSQDLRGFKYGGAGPVDSENDELPLGGSTKLLSQHEMRYAFTENLSGHVFFDVGTLSDKAFGFDTPRASIGTGARMRLPIASLSIDLAVPVIREDNDQTQIFHFAVTSAF
jgi:outer membrane protein insertion porin family